MHLGTIEAMKSIVELGLGMALVPDGAIVEPRPGIVVRPVDPPVPCTMALIEHRSKPSDPALDIVRDALFGLKTGPATETPAPDAPSTENEG